MQPKAQDGRYTGRRRVPTPPRSRYAAVVTTAVVGAGVVVLGAGAAAPDSSSGSTDAYSVDAATASVQTVEDRVAAQDRANRAADRAGPASTVEQAAPDVWYLPLRRQYQITTLYEMRWGEMHYGVDLAVPYGTPIYAVHSGTVVLSRYNGGCGNAVEIDHGNNVVTRYCHGSKLLVKEGQHVEAGTPILQAGNTGFSFGDHLHFEVLVNGKATDPIPWMLAHGVDIAKRLEAANGAIIIP
ncbi:M23 family metallopeptidase [Luedemannella helvata]|uniref:M23ase beta-sheet core domain-containing protein n=1 Tax=Luedemannella helvata TaxID=349315 RepID=A0ABP4VUJ5_9ACTN